MSASGDGYGSWGGAARLEQAPPPYHQLRELGSAVSSLSGVRAEATIREKCYFNVRSKADMSQLNLPHGNNN